MANIKELKKWIVSELKNPRTPPPPLAPYCTDGIAAIRSSNNNLIAPDKKYYEICIEYRKNGKAISKLWSSDSGLEDSIEYPPVDKKLLDQLVGKIEKKIKKSGNYKLEPLSNSKNKFRIITFP